MKGDLKYVILSNNADYYDVVYNKFLAMSNVQYIRSLFLKENKIQDFLLRQYFFRFRKLTSKFKIFNQLWNKYLFKCIEETDNTICFVFTERTIFLIEYDTIQFLINKFPNSKFVCYLQDVVSSISNFKLQKLHDTFDLIISYDKVEADKIRALYYPTPYSGLNLNSPKGKGFDILFVGRAKNRLQLIFDTYKHLVSIGLTCKFIISDVPSKYQRKLPNIEYKRISYIQNLELVQNCSCILEIMQEEANGYTLRTWEAIYYNKLLLTNNSQIITAPFYNSNMIMTFNQPSTIKKSFFEKKDLSIDPRYKSELDPSKLLEFINRELHKL